MNALAEKLAVRDTLRACGDIAVLVVAGSFPLALLAFYTANTPLRLLTVALQLSVFAYMTLISDNRPMKMLCISLVALCLPVALLNVGSTESKSLILPLCFLGGVGCAWCAFEFHRTRWLFEFPFYAYLAVTLYLILVRGYGPAEFNEVYAGISRNGYSAILFSTACGYVISREWRGLAPSLWLLAFALFCTIPLYGRSSIAAMAVVFAAVMMKRWPRFAIVIAAFTTIAIVLGSLGMDALASATNFKGGIESVRWVIVDEYLSLMNPGTFAFGVPFDDVWAIRENGGSPDIAFLRLHSFLGVGMLLFVGWFAVSAFALVRDRHYLLLGLFVAVIFRASTDIILMFGTVDYFYVALLVHPGFAMYWPSRGDQRT